MPPKVKIGSLNACLRVLLVFCISIVAFNLFYSFGGLVLSRMPDSEQQYVKSLEKAIFDLRKKGIQSSKKNYK